MDCIFDLSKLDFYSAELLNLAERKMPKETKKFMQKEGLKLKRVTLNKARSKTKKKSGNYYKGIKRGKVYLYRGNGGTSVRVYCGKPAFHGHLIEYGHRIIEKSRVINNNGRYQTLKAYPLAGGGKEIGFVPGLHVFADSRKEFKEDFYIDIQSFLEEVAKKL